MNMHFTFLSCQIMFFCNVVCVNGTNRLYNSMTSDGLRATGMPQRCDNGGWSSICTTGSVDPDIPNLVCQNLSYASQYANSV